MQKTAFILLECKGDRLQLNMHKPSQCELMYKEADHQDRTHKKKRRRWNVLLIFSLQETGRKRLNFKNQIYYTMNTSYI